MDAREERWRDAVDKADFKGGEVRKSEEEEVEVALAPPEGSLRASQWKQRHRPLQFQLEWPTPCTGLSVILPPLVG